MRFTVRRPASAEVSPCCHRPSGGDVTCGVHVGIARARSAGDTLENRLALAVFRRDMPALGASLRRIRCRDEFEPPKGFMLQPGNQQSPSLAADLAVEAAFLCDAGTRVFTGPARRAGHRAHVQVLDADSVEASRHFGGGLSAQSRRRSASRARKRAMASLIRARRAEPRCARARRCCNRRSRLVSPARRLGARSSSPLDRATETAMPRSIPTTLPSLGPAMGSGMVTKAMCQRPERSRVTR